MGLKEFYGIKNFRVQENKGSKKFWVWKNFRSEEYIGSEKQQDWAELGQAQDKLKVIADAEV